MKKIVILTEAGHNIGMGHLTRMRSLSERLDTSDLPYELYVQLDDLSETIELQNHEKSFRWINDRVKLETIVTSGTLVVVDTYSITKDCLDFLADISARLVVIDDNNRLGYEKSIIINPNYFGKYIEYPDDKSNTYYTGADYNLIRPEFTEAERLIQRSVDTILITLGGTDVNNLTDRIIDYCHTVDDSVSLEIVATSHFNNLDKIREHMGIRDRLHLDIGAEEMNRLMHSVDFAIASAGGTSNELIKTRCPSVLIRVADNQNNTKYLEDRNFFLSFTESDFSGIDRMFEAATRKSIYDVLKKESTSHSAKDIIQDIYDAI